MGWRVMERKGADGNGKEGKGGEWQGLVFLNTFYRCLEKLSFERNGVGWEGTDWRGSDRTGVAMEGVDRNGLDGTGEARLGFPKYVLEMLKKIKL